MPQKRFTGCKYISMGSTLLLDDALFISTISSVMLMASSWSWVTKIVVTPVSSWMRRISSRISSLRRASDWREAHLKEGCPVL